VVDDDPTAGAVAEEVADCAPTATAATAKSTAAMIEICTTLLPIFFLLSPPKRFLLRRGNL
jgi:hypothetical protein